MVIYISLKDCYLSGWSSTRSNENDIKLWIDSDHEVLNNPEIFKYENSELIKDEIRQQQLIDEYEQAQNELTEIERLQQDNDMLAVAVMELTALFFGGE